MPSTIITPVADALEAKAEALTDVTAYKWVLRDTDVRPAAVVELPEVARIAPQEAESQLGSNDWDSTWTVAFYVDFDPNSGYGQEQIVEIVEAWVSAIDADRTLAGVCEEAKVVHLGPPDYVHNEANTSRSYLVYPTKVEVFDLVAS